MTLIGFATYGDSAELVVDSTTYSRSKRDVRVCTKFTPLTHVDAVVAISGDNNFSINATAVLLDLRVASFDELIESAGGAMRWAWDHTDPRDDEGTSVVFLIGFSGAAGEFVAYAVSSDEDFQVRRIEEECLVTPAAISFRPSEHELAHMRRRHPDYAEMINDWEQEEPLEKPRDPEEWLDVVKEVRYGRSLVIEAMPIMVAGTAYWVRITRDTLATMTLYEFNDTGVELELLVYGTLHPRAQVSICAWCDKGELAALDCCLLKKADEPCKCGSDSTFRECCMLTPSERVAAEQMDCLVTPPREPRPPTQTQTAPVP